MFTYDQTQLEKDINLILKTFGKRTVIGFFSYYVFEEGSFRIMGDGDTFSEMFVSQYRLSKEMSTQSYYGYRILQLALKAEEKAEENVV